MRPSRVPDDLIEAGFNAIRAWRAAHPEYQGYLNDRTQMRIALAAALTVHNEQVEQPLRKRTETAEGSLAESRTALSVAADLIDRLAFDDGCDYDHHACCQAHSLHGYPCPHPLGRQFVEAWRAVEAEQQSQGAPGGPA